MESTQAQGRMKAAWMDTAMTSMYALDYYRAMGTLTPKLEAELASDLKFFGQPRLVSVTFNQAAEARHRLAALNATPTPSKG